MAEAQQSRECCVCYLQQNSRIINRRDEQQGNAPRSIKMCARVIAVVVDAVVALI